MNKKSLDYLFVFHATDENKEFIIDKVKNTYSNREVRILKNNLKTKFSYILLTT